MPLSLRARLATFTLGALIAAPAVRSNVVQAQSTAAAAPAPAARAANPADVTSIDAIVKALYESICGPKAQPRDFDRLRTLFAPGARMIPTGIAADGKARLRNWNVEEYITAAGPGLMANGFFEREIGRTTESFGNVWHIMSVYDSRYTPTDKPFARGINSIQLFNGGDRWYIVSVFWDSERPGNPIPAERITVKDQG